MCAIIGLSVVLCIIGDYDMPLITSDLTET